MREEPSKIRCCAIYTRVSTEHGLEQDFNSLDAQREACAAFVKSQAHEGWRPLPDLYDDGGYSGGSLDRPAVQGLLAAVKAGRIDIVVVYKVDRLTRSLADFAKLVELFDRHGVSFVSVTQSFNTTTSMGRLTLNVLLSFAQFEREVTAERIRDKIAASKKKGIRVGGPVPLGYRVEAKKLVVDETEAATVQLIFERYRALGSLNAVVEDLDNRGIVSKVTRLKGGGTRGGVSFTRSPLHYLLRNRVYVGDIVHKGRHFAGEHEPIVERALFDSVQAMLAEQANREASDRIGFQALLKGRIYDDLGHRMSPSTTNKAGARHRYYVSRPAMAGRRAEAGTVARVPAVEIEATVTGALRQVASNAPSPADDRSALHSVERVIVRRGELEIRLAGQEGAVTESVRVPWTPAPSRRRRDIIHPDGADPSSARPIRAETRARLIEAIAKARRWLAELVDGRSPSIQAIAEREGCSERSVRMTLNLAFLAPDIVKAAIDGTLADGTGVTRLSESPADWTEQRQWLLAG